MEQYAVRYGGCVETWSWGGFCIKSEWITLLLAVNSFLQSWIYIQGHWGSWLLQLYAVNTVDSISYRRWGPYVNWCSLTCVQPRIPSWFSPTSPEPCLLHHQLLGSVLIRLPHCCLHSSPSCLHSSPTCSSPSRTHLLPPHLHPPPHSQSSSRSSNRVASSAPISFSSSSPHPLGIQLCWLCGAPFSPPSVCTHWSLCSEPGSSAQDTEGRWKKGPAIPSFSSRGRPALRLPTALSGCTWWFMSPPATYKLWMQEGALAQHLLSQEPCTCCAFFQNVSLDTHRAPMSPHLRQQLPLFFLQSTGHSPIAHFLYLFRMSSTWCRVFSSILTCGWVLST